VLSLKETKNFKSNIHWFTGRISQSEGKCEVQEYLDWIGLFVWFFEKKESYPPEVLKGIHKFPNVKIL
jgi:hypothetical protein